jgi:hypothetical protein
MFSKEKLWALKVSMPWIQLTTSENTESLKTAWASPMSLSLCTEGGREGGTMFSQEKKLWAFKVSMPWMNLADYIWEHESPKHERASPMSLSLCSLRAWEGEEPCFHKRSYKPWNSRPSRRRAHETCLVLDGTIMRGEKFMMFDI